MVSVLSFELTRKGTPTKKEVLMGVDLCFSLDFFGGGMEFNSGVYVLGRAVEFSTHTGGEWNSNSPAARVPFSKYWNKINCRSIYLILTTISLRNGK